MSYKLGVWDVWQVYSSSKFYILSVVTPPSLAGYVYCLVSMHFLPEIASSGPTLSTSWTKLSTISGMELEQTSCWHTRLLTRVLEGREGAIYPEATSLTFSWMRYTVWCMSSRLCSRPLGCIAMVTVTSTSNPLHTHLENTSSTVISYISGP